MKAKFNLSGYKDVEKKKVVVGGMFPVHKRISSSDGNTSRLPVSSGCEGFNFRTFRWTQTMLFAINEINGRTELLPNTDLGYVIYDSCFTISKAVEGTLTYLTGQDEAVPNYRCGSGAPLAALVGAGGSDLSIATARILGLYHFPQVSYSSTCSALENKFQFPTFLRTIPNDKHQSTAIAQLVLRFGWTWVGTIAADDDYGKYAIKDFKEQVEGAGVCISFSEVLPKVTAFSIILQSSFSLCKLKPALLTIVEDTAKIIVVFSSDVDLSPLIQELLQHNARQRAVEGNATMPRAVRGVPDGLCSGRESIAQLGNTYSDVVYKAVYAVANALHNLEHCEDGQGPFVGGSCANISNFEPWQVNLLDGNGEISYVTVGNYNGSAAPEDRMTLRNDSIILLGQCAVRSASRAPGRGSGRESRSAALTASPVPMERSATQPVVLLLNLGTPLVKANDALLSFSLLLSLVVTFLCSIVFLGEPQHWSCMTSQAVACTVWLLILPPHPVENTSAQNIKIILECDEGSVIFICCIFGYDMLLALLA
ncbi:hypothetical protein F7725_021028, partial [Dissostichus mawsoni]